MSHLSWQGSWCRGQTGTRSQAPCHLPHFFAHVHPSPKQSQLRLCFLRRPPPCVRPQLHLRLCSALLLFPGLTPCLCLSCPPGGEPLTPAAAPSSTPRPWTASAWPRPTRWSPQARWTSSDGALQLGACGPTAAAAAVFCGGGAPSTRDRACAPHSRQSSRETARWPFSPFFPPFIARQALEPPRCTPAAALTLFPPSAMY